MLLYACALSVRPLNANDLFWHLATGREILRTQTLPRVDAFSFTSDRHEWVDHEWLWQGAAQIVYAAAARGGGPTPDPVACAALIAVGALVVLGAFLLGLRRLAEVGVPPAGLVGIGLIAAETARERLMVRPETASLLFLGVVLTLLSRRPPGLRRGLLVAVTTAVWVNVHPAALLVPGIVVLWGLGTVGARQLAGPSSGGGEPRLGLGRMLGPVMLESALAAAATCVSPYGARLWSVPLALARTVKTRTYVNPEWLSPPLSRFPLFYLAAAILVAAAIAVLVRSKRLPDGSLLVALVLGALAMHQMRHLGLFAVAFLFAGGSVLRAFEATGALRRALAGGAVTLLALLGALGAAAPAAAKNLAAMSAEGGLDPGRFPVAACERIAVRAPAIRLYNDVQFGGYLIWRLFPERQVFIDGRNELYTALLPRLAAIHAGEAPYSEWRALIRDHGIEGAVVKYQEGKKGVIYPPSSPGGPPVLGYRSWSAFLFPVSEWALVDFDDTALIFMRRGRGGESWIRSGEYRDYNPEDRDYLLERARQDPSLAERLRVEARRRLSETPPSRRTERFLEDLEAPLWR